MAVMSFAHLKNKTQKEQSDASLTDEFEKSRKDAPAVKINQNYRIPAVALTARLSAVNYCQGCDRFIKADTGATISGGYGWCLRKGKIGSDDEEWKPIPESAKVEQCRYWIEFLKNEKKGE